jgi:anti-sigma regulatory factor (Ser/Thr protein kinase)
METMAPTRPTAQTSRHIMLRPGPAAAAEARAEVRAAICAWEAPVDESVAALLASELVTNAVVHVPAGTAMLVVTCGHGQLRVDVHDTSCVMPVLMDAAADAENGRGLMMVASLAADWGFYPTHEGKAVYFTLAFGGRPGEAAERLPRPGRSSYAR